MSAKDALTPRVFIVRHGETEWSLSGQFTSYTDLDLIPAGAQQVSIAAKQFVGDGKLIDPCRLAQVFVSPRRRARTTLELLLPSFSGSNAEKTTFTEDITEWDYGKYEGMKKEEIRNLRRNQGLDMVREWNVWSDGCEEGESVQQVTDRLDNLISRIKDIQRPHMHGMSPADIVIVAHGLILRCFVNRWLGFAICDSLSITLLPGAVGVLSYKDNNINETTLHAGIALPNYCPSLSDTL